MSKTGNSFNDHQTFLSTLVTQNYRRLLILVKYIYNVILEMFGLIFFVISTTIWGMYYK